MRGFRNRAARRQQPSSPAPGELLPAFRPGSVRAGSNLSALQRREPCLLISCWTPPAVPGPRRQCPAIMPAGSHRTRAAVTRQIPTVEEIVAVMRQAGDTRHRRRMRGLIVVLWRAGVQIHEALTLAETDLNELRGSLLIRHGKGDRRREVGMDPWAWAVLADWTVDRAVLPPGALFCVIDGPTRGRAWCATAVRAELRHLAVDAGVRRRFAPHQLRHAHAVELLHEGIPLPPIQRQLGHAYLSTTGTYLEGISSEEIIGAIHGRKAPMMHASTGLEL